MYGIAAQVLVDSFGKLYFVMWAVGGFPIGIRDALKLGIPFACALAVLCASGLSGRRGLRHGLLTRCRSGACVLRRRNQKSVFSERGETR